MTTTSNTLAAALLCLPLLAPAAQHIVDIAWRSDGTFRHAATVAPGRFVELCGKLDVGDTIDWQFDAAAPLDFNIHYHQGKEAVFPAKMPQVVRGSDALKATVAQDYCWMWTNKGAAPVQMSVELKR
jgi:hypothetical protein